MNKRYGSNGRVVSYRFTGRGWGHGVGMCQYGAYGFAQMGLGTGATLVVAGVQHTSAVPLAAIMVAGMVLAFVTYWPLTRGVAAVGSEAD